ncbi:hypothetical protein HP1_114 [Candidatus Termititenax spirochaetophilus]|uniref:Uncharacterized protein n=1 Tax=Candidatus Termititenax spirochaetophilus TaxID=2218522 RepID=A0A388T7B8_9BACT|nr:hypothetical protein HP1_114 [Candidatus Termititenax spirochaetophilus]
MSIVRKFVLTVLVWGLAFANPGSIDLSVTVVGNMFSLELQDASAFPAAGTFDLGTLSPGSRDFPVNGVIVAGCKSNSGQRWTLQAEQTDPLLDPATDRTMPDGSVLVRGLLSSRSIGGESLPGNLVSAAQPVTTRPIVVYTSDPRGDAGFNNYEGTYVPLNFGVRVPAAMPAGSYSGRVMLTLTE